MLRIAWRCDSRAHARHCFCAALRPAARRSIYLVLALTDCGGDWQRFWMGARAPPAAMHDKEH